MVVVKKTTPSDPPEDAAGGSKYQRPLSDLYTLTLIESGSTLYPVERFRIGILRSASLMICDVTPEITPGE